MQRFLLLVALAVAQAAGAASASVATWGAAPDSAGPPLADQTVRQLLRASAAGAHPRIRLSNAYGTAPLQVGAVRLARSAGGGAIRPGSDRLLRFGGSATVTIPAGGAALSDAIDFAVGPLEELAVSIYVKGPGTPSTIHSDARQDAYITGPGDASASLAVNGAKASASRYFLSEMLVEAPAGARALVVVGDSISDGDRSTPGRNARWPDGLAARLQADPALASIAVVNAGISGNRLLNDGPVGAAMLRRFERDALAREGVRWIVLEAGLNDIGLSGEPGLPGGALSAGQVIEGLTQLAARARKRGIEVWGATLTPYGAAEQPLRHNRAAEAKRLAVNAWIRAPGNVDRVLDFDAAVRDPRQPARILPSLDSGDHVHPNDVGYRALAAAVPLRFFSEPATRALPAAAPPR